MTLQRPSDAQLRRETDAILARWRRAHAALSSSAVPEAKPLADRLLVAIDLEAAKTSSLAARHWWTWTRALNEAEKGPGKTTEPLPPLRRDNENAA